MASVATQTTRHSLPPYTLLTSSMRTGTLSQIPLYPPALERVWHMTLCNKYLLNEQTVPTTFMPKQIITPHNCRTMV